MSDGWPWHSQFEHHLEIDGIRINLPSKFSRRMRHDVGVAGQVPWRHKTRDVLYVRHHLADQARIGDFLALIASPPRAVVDNDIKRDNSHPVNDEARK